MVLRPARFRKASPDDPEHPGWPKGTEGGLGGGYRPKDGAEAAITREAKRRIKRAVVRRALRTSLLAALRIGVETIANLVPVVDLVADVPMVADIANTISEFKKLSVEAATAFDFVSKGPHNIEDLQVSSSGYEEFSSYREFCKDESGLDIMAKRFGSAGPGSQYHHIVTQGGVNERKIPAQRLQNTDNIVRLPTLLHEPVSAEYLKDSPDPNLNMYPVAANPAIRGPTRGRT